jgi:hypothetical protein
MPNTIEVDDAKGTAGGDGKKQIAVLKRYTVFNAEQIDGIEARYPAPLPIVTATNTMNTRPTWTPFLPACLSPCGITAHSLITSRAVIMSSCGRSPTSTPATIIFGPCARALPCDGAR